MAAVTTATAVAADALRLQRWIAASQSPKPGSTCADLDGSQHMTGYFHGLGLGAQLVSLKFGLLHAMLHGQVYHFPTSHYVNPLRCAARTFDCYFEPPSPCRADSHRRLRKPPIKWCADIPRSELSRRANLSTIYPNSWYHAQLAAYLFRPNAAMSRYMEALLPMLDMSEPSSNASRAAASATSAAAKIPKWKRGTMRTQPARRRSGRSGGADQGRRLQQAAAPALGSSVRDARARSGNVVGGAGGSDGAGRLLNLSRCVAVHIRRTDKFTTHRREDHLAPKDFPNFAQVFKSWAYWQQTTSSAHLSVLLGSEDKATFSAFPPLIAPVRAFWVPSSAFVMDMSAGKAFKSINQGNSRLQELYSAAQTVAAAREAAGKPASTAALMAAAAAGDAEAAELLKDEGMVLIAQMLVMGRCKAFIGSFASNVGVVVHDLMLAKQSAEYPRYTGYTGAMHALDINGRVYCGCGASFCMRIERKATLDPTRTLEDVVRAVSG